jgi:hypothetical protein
MLRYLVDNGRCAVFLGGRARLAVSKKLEDRALGCDDDAGSSVFVFVGPFLFAFSPSSTSITKLPLRLGLRPILDIRRR